MVIEVSRRLDAIETVVAVFNEAMAIQEIYLKKGKFKELSMSETHVLDAIDKVDFPSMINISNEFYIIVCTLTNAVKNIAEK